METDIEKSKTFNERMSDRVRESIGELMTDEELKLIVERTVENTFFKETIIPGSGYSSSTTKPPFLEEVIKGLLEEKVKLAVYDYVRNHDEEVVSIIEKIIQEGAGACFLKAMSNIFENNMFNFQQNIEQNIKNISGNY